MERQHKYCVIMAGGGGGRFWPMTRDAKPKQFLESFGDEKTLLQGAFRRCLDLVDKENILIVTLEKYAHFVREQIPDIKEENILKEPYGKKTAPCIAFATYEILRRDPDAVVAVTPADIVIHDGEEFNRTLENALDYVDTHPVLMTLGIPPTRPDTNYEYIQFTGGASALHQGEPIKVKTFTEKPPEGLAEVFCRSGEFLWNSGVFVWKASVIREEMEKLLPEVTGLFKDWQYVLGTEEQGAFLRKVYSDCDKVSIDYGVMEKTSKAWVLPSKFGWTDLDSWETLYKNLGPKDEEGNVSDSKTVYFPSSKDNLIISSRKDKLMAVKGLENFIVVDTPDALLICPKEEREFKELWAGLGMPGYEKFR